VSPTVDAATANPTALRSLLPYVRPHRRLLTLAIVALVVAAAATLALPLAFRLVIDSGFSTATSGTINRYFLGLFAVAIVLAIATALRFYCVTVFGERVVADVRQAVYRHLLGLDAGFYETTRTGELLSRLTTDTELIQTVLGSTASVALRSALMLLGSSVLLTATSPRLAAMIAIVIPFVVLPIVVFGRRVRRLSRLSQDRIADTNAQASESLSALHTVLAHAREAFEQSRFRNATLAALAAAVRRTKARALLTAIVILLVFGAIAFVLWLGALAVIAGTMSSGELGQFVLYAVIAAGSVGSLSEVWGDMQRAAGAAERLGELLVTRSRIHDPADPVMTPAGPGRIDFDRIDFHYPSRPDVQALSRFELHIQPGETIALVGPSGAGKSTVLQLLLRFYDPQSGTIRLDGTDLRQLPLATLRERLALVPQNPVIFGSDVWNNIRYGRLDATDSEVEAAAKAAEAHEFIMELPQGYDTYLGERGVRLSGGQQQRIAIARALLSRAPVLLLDEATSALDSQSEHLIQQAIQRLMAERTTLVIAHRLATILQADRIVVLDHGRIVAIGEHQALLRQGGLYADLARLQFSHHERSVPHTDANIDRTV
jgi:ATP-binding cassette subfamily B protein